MYGYVYETTNLINGKKYIGQHIGNVFDKNYYGSGTILKQALRKYGKENFSVKNLEFCETLKDLCLKEQYYISLYNAVNSDNYYNLSPGGEDTVGGFKKDMKFTEEHKHKIALSNKRRIENGFRPTVTQKSLDALEAGRHMPASEKLKQSLRERRLNCEVSQSTRDKLAKASLGKKIINNGVRCIAVTKTEVDEYIKDGWKLGHIPGTRKNSKKKINQEVQRLTGGTV
jgi:hypothetical protein